MSFTTQSPNMQLPIPTVGVEPGPDYASDINAALTIVDQHTHAAGSGVQITPDAININASLPFNTNFATGLAGLTLSAQSGTPVNNTVYESGVDLYFVDGLGNNIRLTQSGAVAGTPGSIANLVPPASASYSAGSSTFVFQSNTNIAANMDFGAAIMRNLSPNSTFSTTLRPAAALASNLTFTLPSAVGAPSFMTLDTSGNMSGSVPTSQGIVGSNVANNTLTQTQIATAFRQMHKQIFTASGTFTAPSTASTDTVFKITVIGGGGSGASAGNAASTGAGGGGAGGTAITWLSGIAASSTHTVTVGTGGAAVSGAGAGINGNAGVASSFDSGAVANGGAGGKNTAGFVVGGAGGSAPTGDLLVSGQAGSGGYNVSGLSNNGGTGGASSMGGGGQGGHGTTAAVAGSCGGGGGGSANATSGAGGDGLVIVEWLE